MAWLERMHAARSVSMGALLLLGVACSSDDKPSTGDGNNDDDDTDVETPEGETDEEVDAGSRMDAAKPVTDARIQLPPTVDAGDSGAPVVILTDGGRTKPPATDAALPPISLNPLPHDGEKVSICYGDGDCKGDDLKCSLPTGALVPGACVDDCASDADCPAIDEVKGVCSNPIVGGTFNYPCGGSKNDGKGACPKDMVCRDFGSTGLFVPPDWRCRYPEGGGKKTQKPYQQCEAAHLSGDCEGINVCHQPALSLASAALPHGYCVNVCTQDSDCKGPEGNTSAPICWFGACELNCGVPGGNCPTGMNCMDIDPSLAIATMRCIFID